MLSEVLGLSSLPVLSRVDLLGDLNSSALMHVWWLPVLCHLDREELAPWDAVSLSFCP